MVTQPQDLQWTIEPVPPTGQQAQRLVDGLRLVLELALRRYRHRIQQETDRGTDRDSPC